MLCGTHITLWYKVALRGFPLRHTRKFNVVRDFVLVLNASGVVFPCHFCPTNSNFPNTHNAVSVVSVMRHCYLFTHFLPILKVPPDAPLLQLMKLFVDMEIGKIGNLSFSLLWQLFHNSSPILLIKVLTIFLSPLPFVSWDTRTFSIHHKFLICVHLNHNAELPRSCWERISTL